MSWELVEMLVLLTRQDSASFVKGGRGIAHKGTTARCRPAVKRVEAIVILIVC